MLESTDPRVYVTTVRMFYRWNGRSFDKVEMEEIKPGEYFYHSNNPKQIFCCKFVAVPVGFKGNARMTCDPVDGVPLPF